MVNAINWDLLTNEERYLVGVSGGPDSMFLLDNLVQKGFAHRLVVCHVNYHKRLESDVDAAVVKNYCEKHHVLFFQLDVNYQTLSDNYAAIHNFQAKARLIRYDFFTKIGQQFGIQNLLIAHNYTDHLETYLIQRQRQSLVQWYGLQEKSTLDSGLVIIRIMLQVDRSAIIDYLHNNGIDYALDVSNDSDTYLRNRIRKQLRSLTKSELNALEQEISSQNTALQALSPVLAQITSNKINYDLFMGCQPLERERLLHYFLQKVMGLQLDNKGKTLHEAVKQLSRNVHFIIFKINEEYALVRDKTSIYLVNNENLQTYSLTPIDCEFIMNNVKIKLPRNQDLSKCLITNDKKDYNRDSTINIKKIYKNNLVSLKARLLPLVFWNNKLVYVDEKVLAQLSKIDCSKVKNVLRNNTVYWKNVKMEILW